jgi:hypothetical protein
MLPCVRSICCGALHYKKTQWSTVLFVKVLAAHKLEKISPFTLQPFISFHHSPHTCHCPASLLILLPVYSTVWGPPKPPIQWVPGRKPSRSEADHLLPSVSKFKNACSRFNILVFLCPLQKHILEACLSVVVRWRCTYSTDKEQVPVWHKIWNAANLFVGSRKIGRRTNGDSLVPALHWDAS